MNTVRFSSKILDHGACTFPANEICVKVLEKLILNQEQYLTNDFVNILNDIWNIQRHPIFDEAKVTFDEH